MCIFHFRGIIYHKNPAIRSGYTELWLYGAFYAGNSISVYPINGINDQHKFPLDVYNSMYKCQKQCLDYIYL